MALGCPACLMLLGDGEKPAPKPPAHLETVLVVGCLVATTLLMKRLFKVPGRRISRNSGVKPFRIAGVFEGGTGW